MTKILFLIHDLSYGGAEKVLVNLANNLDKTKYDVTVQTLFDIGVNKKFLNDDVQYIGGWKHYFPKHTKLMKLFSPQTLCKMTIKGDYEIVVSFLEGPSARIVSAYKAKKVAWIHTKMNNCGEFSSSFRSLKEAFECYNNCDSVVCVAETVKSAFIDVSGISPEKCTVLYNVNETEKILKNSEDEQASIVKSDESFNIVSVGRLIPVKRFDRLIDINKKLIEAGIKNKLYILGEGPDREKLQKQIEALGLRDSCFLLGFDENPYKYVSKADLFVCSSVKEGFSTAMTEATVLGVPIVSTEVSGVKELLGDRNEYGIVTDNSDEALYNGVFRILTEKGLLSHYKGQAEIRGKDFSTEKTTKAVEEFFERL